MTIRLGGSLLDLSEPQIMGIVNLTPDSFYDGGSSTSVDTALQKAEKMLSEGADILDIGAQSTRPKAEQIGAQAEWERMEKPLQAIRYSFPEAVLSIDTYHHEVAQKAIGTGAHIINDISGGTMDGQMWNTVAELKVPYILMHIQGTPENMQDQPSYRSALEDITLDLSKKINGLIDAGVDDIIIDPGFGFGKTQQHNYELLKGFEYLQNLGHPLLAGVSRKSMIWKALNTSAEQALNGTSALHMALLMKGANILRVHDVKEAAEVRTLWRQMEKSTQA